MTASLRAGGNEAIVPIVATMPRFAGIILPVFVPAKGQRTPAPLDDLILDVRLQNW